MVTCKRFLPGLLLLLLGFYYRSTSNAARLFPEDQTLILARLIDAEGYGKSLVCKVAIGAVVLNRTASPIYPNAIAGVIYQPGAFASVHNGRLYRRPEYSSLYAAHIALSGLDPSNGAIKFWDPRKTLVNFKWQRKVSVIIDNVFFGS